MRNAVGGYGIATEPSGTVTPLYHSRLRRLRSWIEAGSPVAEREMEEGNGKEEKEESETEADPGTSGPGCPLGAPIFKITFVVYLLICIMSFAMLRSRLFVHANDVLTI